MAQQPGQNTIPLARPQPRLPSLAAVGFLGKNQDLLFLKQFLKETQENEFDDYLSRSKDLLTDRVSSKTAKQYLGLLFRPNDAYQVYAHVTNTKVAILAIIKNVSIKESEVRQMMGEFHDEYIRYVCNPFSVTDQSITSTEFEYNVQIVGNRHTTQIVQIPAVSNAKKQTKIKHPKK